MRIRQRAKLSGISISNSGISSIEYSPICHFNQSPWDLFSSSQIGEDYCYRRNGSLKYSTEIIESLESMKISENENNGDENLSKNHVKESSVFVMCAKTDGKIWQCNKEVVLGQILCEHHLLEKRNNSQENCCKNENLVVNVTKKKRVAPASDPGFYYYSGFGPAWAKQRSIKAAQNGKRMKVDDQEKYEYIDDYESNNNDDEMEDELAEFARKRGRKPVKARSLSTL